MKISKVELQILSKEFMMASNRMLRANFETYGTELKKFLNFLDSKPLIYDYIMSCGKPEFNVEQAFNELNSYSSNIFELGTSAEKEVANIYHQLKYLVDKNVNGRSFVFFGYSSSKKYQNKVDAFGNDYIKVLINHIEMYLTTLSIKMGVNDSVTINVQINDSELNNTQLNILGIGNIDSNQNIGEIGDVDRLLKIILEESKKSDEEQQEIVADCVEKIKTLNEEKPKKGLIKLALNTLKGISCSVEFAAAVATLMDIVPNLLGL